MKHQSHKEKLPNNIKSNYILSKKNNKHFNFSKVN